MKDELKGKYVLPYYYACLLNRRHQFSHDNKSTKEYVAKFDEFLIRCSVIGTESEAPFQFRTGLREDQKMKLLARGVKELEMAYALVQDLDVARSNHAFMSQDQELNKGTPIMSFIAWEVVKESGSTNPPEVTLVIKKFSDTSRKSPKQAAIDAWHPTCYWV